MKKTVKSLAALEGLTLSDLAKKIGKSPSNMSTTLKVGNARLSFIKEVFEALEAEVIVRDKNGNEYKL